MNRKAQASTLGEVLAAGQHDVREPLPFLDETFDAVFFHMLYCIAITNAEIGRLWQEIRRVLKPGGKSIFTVRHTGDPHSGTGIDSGRGDVRGLRLHRELLRPCQSGAVIAGVRVVER